MNLFDTFEARITDIRDKIRTADSGQQCDNLLIELGALIAAEELTNPVHNLAKAIIESQKYSLCEPENYDKS